LIRRFRLDRIALALLIAASLVVAARVWLAEHPEHDPWAPLGIDDPVGWATPRKLAALRGDPAECRAVLERAGIAFTAREPAGVGACRRGDRTLLAGDRARGLVLRPAGAEATCPVAAGLALWLRHSVQPAAEAGLGTRVVALEHYGTASCRRIGGGQGEGQGGRWSEHATGNAIDIAAFVLGDGRRIGVAEDWAGADDEAAFLKVARDGACEVFATTLSPDYNAAHADHLHLDQARRGWGGFCR
jgi:hypothetical protein